MFDKNLQNIKKYGIILSQMKGVIIMCEDLKIIKKKYGEKMMRLCRELFPTIMDNHPGLLSTLILEAFDPSRELYDDIVNRRLEIMFKNYIYSIYEQLTCVKEKVSTYVEDPVTLLRRAGYTLYECKSEQDIQKFKKYYIQGEMLCTFTQRGRLRNCYVYFAVKDGADKLKRSDFHNPRRQDEYGTSVLSIQFTRDKSHTISIKNRYNHTVINPDATFSNNLDNIIMGLSQSFADYYGMKPTYVASRSFEIPGYVRANDGKFYKYNYEINNVYYCPGNVVVDNFQVFAYPREKYLVMDYFVIDLVNRKFITKTDDAFPETIGEIKGINIVNRGEEKIVTIIPENGEEIVIVLDKFQRIISLKNNNVKEIGNNFLRYNQILNKVYLNNVLTIGDGFLFENEKVREIELENVAEIGKDFMFKGQVRKITLPNVKTIGNNFMWENMNLRMISLPKVIKLGKDFLYSNYGLDDIYMPKVVKIEDNFLPQNNELKKIILPEVLEIGNRFCFHGKNVEEMYAPKLLKIGDYFLTYNQGIVDLNLMNVEEIGNSFMRWNQSVKTIIFPNLLRIGHDALINNKKIELVEMPKVIDLDNNVKIGKYIEQGEGKKLELIR